jgi:hypothetical protein
MTENHDTRGRLLQQVWSEIRSHHESTVRNHPCAARAIEAGASPKDLVTAMTAASYETAFRLLFLLSAEHAEEGDSEATIGWTLAEANVLESGEAVPNGSHALDFLHEDPLSSDPTGLEGQDLFR